MSQGPHESAVPDYGAPPIAQPAAEPSEPAQMSPMSRLVNIFFSPGEVFEDVRRSARDWWLPMVIYLLIATGVGYVVQLRLNLTPERVAAAAVDLQLEREGRTRKDLTPEVRAQYEQGEKFQAMMMRYAPILAAVMVPIAFAVGAGIYMLLAMIFGARPNFFRMLSVVAYSFFASGVVQSLLQLLLAFLRSPDDVDPKSFLLNKGSILAASPAAFVSADDNPVLFTALSYFDVFSIWYLVLVTIGIAMVSKKIKMGSAALIAFGPYVLWAIVQVLIAVATT